MLRGHRPQSTVRDRRKRRGHHSRKRGHATTPLMVCKQTASFVLAVQRDQTVHPSPIHGLANQWIRGTIADEGYIRVRSHSSDATGVKSAIVRRFGPRRTVPPFQAVHAAGMKRIWRPSDFADFPPDGFATPRNSPTIPAGLRMVRQNSCGIAHGQTENLQNRWRRMNGS